ncbi:MAG: PQQ-binding-like beta-propeller repeat protein [Elusimicrobia bacterium]|nr:PQQ-binding-like beta-propeller repeat protein [Candidatus Liberimonas magnetica]
MNRKHLHIISFIIFMASFVFASEDKMFMVNESRNGQINDVYFEGFTPLWQKELFAGLRSSPITFRDYVYICAGDGSVWCFDANSGKDVWQYSTGGDIVSTPLASSSTIVAASTDGNVYGFIYNSLTGNEPRWSYDTHSYLYSSPVITGDKVFILTGYPNSKVLSLNVNTGSFIGQFDVSAFGFSSMAAKDNYLVVGTNDGKWHCLNSSNGTALWQTPFQTDSSMRYAGCSIDGNNVYIPGCGETTKIYSLLLNGGQKSWETQEIDKLLTSNQSNTYTVSSSIAQDESRLYLNYSYYDASKSTDSSKIVCVNKANGNVLWVSSTTGISPKTEQLSSPVISGDYVYVGSGSGYVYILNKVTGNIVTKYYISKEPISSTVNLSNGKMYVASDKFYCFKASSTFYLSKPFDSDQLYTVTPVSGTVMHPELQNYQVDYKADVDTNWTYLSSGTTQVVNKKLATWDVTKVKDGIYTLRLTANINSSAYRAVNKAVVNNIPLGPSGLAARDTPFDSGGSISLNWTKSGDDGSGNEDVIVYRIYRGTTPYLLGYYTQVNAGTTTYTDNQCPVYQTYYYRMTSYDGLNESLESGIASAHSELDGSLVYINQSSTVTLTSGGYMTEVTVASGTFSNKVWIGIKISTAHTNVTLPSTMKGTNIVRDFTIYPATMTFLKPATIKIHYKNSDITGITNEYNLRISTWDNTNGQWSVINSSAYTTAKYVKAQVTHFSYHRILEYTLASSTGSNPPPSNPPPSNPPPSNPPPSNPPGADTTAPNPPTNLTAIDKPLDPGGVLVLNWTKSSDDGAGAGDVSIYRIFKGTSSLTMSYYTEVSSGTTVYVDSACPVYILYYYKLSAVDTSGNYAYSSTVSAFSEMDGYPVLAAAGATIDLIVNGSTTTVIIEAGGLSNDARVGIKIPRSSPQLNIPSFSKATDILRDFIIIPSTTIFFKNILIKIPYMNSDVVDMKKENLRIFWADISNNTWKTVNTSDATLENGRVWAVIPHFSYYRIMEYLPGKEDLISGNKVYTYPNPATGNKLFFKYYLGDKADITIDVYDIAGELIAHLTKDGCPAGIFSEIEWNISGIASGVYIYRFAAKTPYGTRYLKKKLAIVH